MKTPAWIAENCKFAQVADPEQVFLQCEKVQTAMIGLMDMVKGDHVAMSKMNQAWDRVAEVYAQYYQNKKVTDIGQPT